VQCDDAVIPRRDVTPDPTLPAAATFWTPSIDDLSGDEGFGYFRDVWVIADVRAAEAEEVADLEAHLASVVDTLAADAIEFDQIATAIENGEREALPARFQTTSFDAQIDMVLKDELPSLGGLELGAAGLVYALASVDCFPAASCRGHPENSWSDVPVVLFAADRRRSELIASLAKEADCGLEIDPARPNLISIYAASIANLMALTRAILRDRSRFDQIDLEAL
jgi:hypothetical protein